MASAASTISFSTLLISRSRVEAMVGAGCCDSCGGAALAAGALLLLYAPNPRAAGVKMTTANSEKIRGCFIRVTPLI